MSKVKYSLAVFMPMSSELAPALSRLSANSLSSWNGPASYESRVYQKPVLLASTGVGPKMTRKNIRNLLERFEFKRVLFMGVAGAVEPGLKAGDVICPQYVKTASKTDTPGLENKCFECACDVPKDIIRRGVLYQVPRIYRYADKMELKKQDPDAIALDMESWAAMDVFRSCSVPCLVLRAIVDSVEFDLPPVELYYSGKFIDKLCMVRDILCSPTHLRNVFLLRSNMKKACGRLADVAVKIIEEVL